MLEKDKLRIFLENKKDLIDRLLGRINEQDDIAIRDLRELFDFTGGPKFYYYDKAVIKAIEELIQVVQENRHTCKFSQENEGVIQMLVSSSKIDGSKPRETGLKEIRDFTKDANELIIIDPYIFGGETKDTDNYVDEFKKASRIDNSSINKIHIIYSSSHGNTKSIKTEIKKLAELNHCKITTTDKDIIHDRIWIKNNKEAIVVGTSFGGIGARACFILELPKYDLERLLEFIDNNKLLTNKFV